MAPTTKHKIFDELTIHTAKCDICDQRNQSILRRCTTCAWAICTPCYEKQNGNTTHGLNEDTDEEEDAEGEDDDEDKMEGVQSTTEPPTTAAQAVPPELSSVPTSSTDSHATPPAASGRVYAATSNPSVANLLHTPGAPSPQAAAQMSSSKSPSKSKGKRRALSPASTVDAEMSDPHTGMYATVETDSEDDSEYTPKGRSAQKAVLKPSSKAKGKQRAISPTPSTDYEVSIKVETDSEDDCGYKPRMTSSGRFAPTRAAQPFSDTDTDSTEVLVGVQPSKDGKVPAALAAAARAAGARLKARSSGIHPQDSRAPTCTPSRAYPSIFDNINAFLTGYTPGQSPFDRAIPTIVDRPPIDVPDRISGKNPRPRAAEIQARMQAAAKNVFEAEGSVFNPTPATQQVPSDAAHQQTPVPVTAQQAPATTLAGQQNPPAVAAAAPHHDHAPKGVPTGVPRRVGEPTHQQLEFYGQIHRLMVHMNAAQQDEFVRRVKTKAIKIYEEISSHMRARAVPVQQPRRAAQAQHTPQQQQNFNRALPPAALPEQPRFFHDDTLPDNYVRDIDGNQYMVLFMPDGRAVFQLSVYVTGTPTPTIITPVGGTNPVVGVGYPPPPPRPVAAKNVPMSYIVKFPRAAPAAASTADTQPQVPAQAARKPAKRKKTAHQRPAPQPLAQHPLAQPPLVQHPAAQHPAAQQLPVQQPRAQEPNV
jgi:hypothetical protein